MTMRRFSPAHWRTGRWEGAMEENGATSGLHGPQRDGRCAPVCRIRGVPGPFHGERVVSGAWKQAQIIYWRRVSRLNQLHLKKKISMSLLVVGVPVDLSKYLTYHKSECVAGRIMRHLAPRAQAQPVDDIYMFFAPLTEIQEHWKINWGTFWILWNNI